MKRKGRPLPPGGTIGIPAPGWTPGDPDEVGRAVAWWEERGYRVKLSRRVRSGRQGYGTQESVDRASEVNAMFADPEVDAIQCYEAGYGTALAVPHLDVGVIRDNPKPFIGFSDITTLHLALWNEAALVTLYGPLLSSVGRPGKEPTLEAMHRTLTTTEPLGDVPSLGRPLRTWGSGRASGELIGGTLSPLIQSIGTSRQPDLRGRILLAEDVAKPPYVVCEWLTQMRQAGMLDGVAGVVVGEMAACDWRTVPESWPRLMSLDDVLEELLGPLGVPVLYGLPVGHGDQLITVPLGVRATVDADGGSLTVDEPAFRAGPGGDET